MGRPPKELLGRLAKHFTVGDGCWEWTGAKHLAGYGRTTIGSAAFLAHRVVYELLAGPIEPGAVCDHKCHNRVCVRPDHIDITTSGINSSRSAKALDWFCAKGHELKGENDKWSTDSQGRRHRRCRTCLNVWRRERRRLVGQS